MKILIIYPYLTHPVDAGNRHWVLSQVEELRRLGQEIFMLCVNVPGLKSDLSQNRREIYETQKFWGNHGFIYNAGLRERIRTSCIMNFRRIFNAGYYKCDDLYLSGLTAYVSKLQEIHHFDACIVNYYWLTKIFEEVFFSRTAINTHDVFADKDKVLGIKAPWMCTDRSEEAKSVRRAQYVFALQDEESEYFKKIAPQVKVLTVYCPYAMEPMPEIGNHNLVILASGSDLNMDGMEWFLNGVFPSVVNKFPDVKLVVGGGICKLLGDYAGNPNIQLIGRVEEPGGLYKLGDVAINPCRKGTGLKVKTFEALSYGKVCMVHPHSTLGIYDKRNAPLFASDNAEEWVDFLDVIWNEPGRIAEVKQRCIEYIDSMNSFIDGEYKSFLAEK